MMLNFNPLKLLEIITTLKCYIKRLFTKVIFLDLYTESWMPQLISATTIMEPAAGRESIEVGF